jgi:hypothetical protein
MVIPQKEMLSLLKIVPHVDVADAAPQPIIPPDFAHNAAQGR